MSVSKVLCVVSSKAAAHRLSEALPEAVVRYPGEDLSGDSFDEVVYLGGKDVQDFDVWWESQVVPRVSSGAELTVAPECTPWARARGLC